MPLRNLRPLRDNMRETEQAVTVFDFHYNNNDFFVAVCLLTERELTNPNHKYDLVRLCFMQADNVANYLDCYANSRNITAGLTELRHFLDVEYQVDGFGWLGGFLHYLGRHIPEEVPPLNIHTRQVALNTVCRNEGRDPNRTYRWSMIRNPKDENGKQHYRTEYNAQLASFKFPNLYPRFQEDRTISFGFIDNPDNEKTEEEILNNFTKNERKRDGKK